MTKDEELISLMTELVGTVAMYDMEEAKRLGKRVLQVPLTDDTHRLDALAKNSWDLRCFDMGDDDIGWRVIEHHMAKPHERTVAEVFRDDPRQAIDAAIEAATPEKGQKE